MNLRHSRHSRTSRFSQYLLFLLPLLCLNLRAQDPVYMRLDNGWEGFFPRKDQFVKYEVSGKDVKLQDAYHILLKPGLGLMVNFAKKRDFKKNLPLLEAHRKWEVDYWKENADKVETKDRSDLLETKKEYMVTELNLQSGQKKMTLYLIGVPAKDGVFVFAISPVTKEDDELVRTFINSIQVENKAFDPKEEREKIVK